MLNLVSEGYNFISQFFSIEPSYYIISKQLHRMTCFNFKDRKTGK